MLALVVVKLYSDLAKFSQPCSCMHDMKLTTVSLQVAMLAKFRVGHESRLNLLHYFFYFLTLSWYIQSVPSSYVIDKLCVSWRRMQRCACEPMGHIRRLTGNDIKARVCVDKT
jgi:hypothetical protein